MHWPAFHAERVLPSLQRAPAIVRRWVPFVAVVAANCVNIPVMRQRELIDGIVVTDREGKDLAKSKVSMQGSGCTLAMGIQSFRWLPEQVFLSSCSPGYY